MAVNGKWIALAVGAVTLIFAIAALASHAWMKDDGADYGLFKIEPNVGNSVDIKDINCGGDGDCKEGVRKTKATSAFMLIGLFCTIAATITSFLNLRVFTILAAAVAAVCYFLAVVIYGSIDRDNAFGPGNHTHLKASFGLAIICLLLSVAHIAVAHFFLEKSAI